MFSSDDGQAPTQTKGASSFARYFAGCLYRLTGLEADARMENAFFEGFEGAGEGKMCSTAAGAASALLGRDFGLGGNPEADAAFEAAARFVSAVAAQSAEFVSEGNGAFAFGAAARRDGTSLGTCLKDVFPSSRPEAERGWRSAQAVLVSGEFGHRYFSGVAYGLKNMRPAPLPECDGELEAFVAGRADAYMNEIPPCVAGAVGPLFGNGPLWPKGTGDVGRRHWMTGVGMSVELLNKLSIMSTERSSKAA